MLVPLSISGAPIPLQNFWNAVYLYYERPHIINRKLTGATSVHFYHVEFDPKSKLTDIINHTSLTYETNKLNELKKETLNNLIGDLLKPYDKNVVLSEIPFEDSKSYDGTFISCRILHASNPSSSDCVELVIFEKAANKVTFLAGSDRNKYKLIAPPFQYILEWSAPHVKLILSVENAESTSAEWLGDKLFPKLMKWAEEYDPALVTKQSLSLISIERYCLLYKELKLKYGRKMIEIWPENTDPLKFVYEDIAIATYLICLWEKFGGKSKPSFVDLGCGNGLLVYILAEEGYPGFGVDVRKRRIWDLYPESVNLEVKTIIPSDASLFPTTDWIIGNHSDELTPWIPVIAARSSPTTNFFVLPCCSYDFNGSKYIRRDPSRSQYSEYLEYIEGVARTCGFNIEIDKLRIPSTKRTCIVSFGRNRLDDAEIVGMINARCGERGCWGKDFQARQVAEEVRNCTKLNRELISKIVKVVVANLLQVINKLPKQGGGNWNAGGELALPQLIKAVDPEDLKQLKNECGGLQTLLRNHRYIFEVVRGTVKLRVPPLLSEVQKYKDKPCWFLLNHPDGCLNSNCAYKH